MARPRAARPIQEGGILPGYQLYFLTPAGRLVAREPIEADTDEEAIARAHRPGDQCVRELWRHGMLVKRTRRHD